MAKRKISHAENSEPAHVAEVSTGSRNGHVDTGSHDCASDELGSLADEVQSFLSRRAELAQKLTMEIEATENRLAELKRTAALLFPPAGISPGDKERQDRKSKKGLPRAAKPERGAPGDDKQLRIEAVESPQTAHASSEASLPLTSAPPTSSPTASAPPDDENAALQPGGEPN
jgi:hypothetical protein